MQRPDFVSSSAEIKYCTVLISTDRLFQGKLSEVEICFNYDTWISTKLGGGSRVVVLIGRRRPLYEVLDCSSRNETVNLNLYSIVQL